MLFHKLTARFRRRLDNARILHAVARRTVIISPAEWGSRPAALHLPGQIERILGVQEETTRDYENDRIHGGRVLHSATLAFELNDVRFRDGHLYTRGRRLSMVTRAEQRLVPKRRQQIAECALVGSQVGDRYFGHFIVDDSATALLAQDYGTVMAPRGTACTNWSHAAPYRDLMELDLPVLDDANIARAWLFQDFGMTANRAARLARLRDRVRAGAAEGRKGHGVYILRADSGSQRLLRNEPQIAEMLSRHGFEIIDPTTQTVEDIVARINGAAIVVSVEGSALAHGLLSMADSGAMVTIQPPRRFNNVWKDFTDTLGMRYGFVVGDDHGDSFSVDGDDLMRTVALVTG